MYGYGVVYRWFTTYEIVAPTGFYLGGGNLMVGVTILGVVQIEFLDL